MKNSWKTKFLFLYAIIIIFVAITVFGILFTRPRKYLKTFNSSISITDLVSIYSSLSIEIDGVISKKFSIKDFN